MKRFIYFLVCLILLSPIQISASQQKSVDVQYFFYNPCGACNTEEEFISMFNEKLGDIKKQSNYNIVTYNTFKVGTEKFERECNRIKIPKEQRIQPMLIIGEQWISGDTSINEGIYSAFSTTVNTVNVEKGKSYIRYYYTASCEDCQETKVILDKIKVEYPNTLIEHLNIVDKENILEIQNLFEKFDVPENKRQVPIIFFEKGYLSGYEEIENNIEKTINNLETKYKNFMDFQINKSKNPITILQLPTIAAAGFINGFNPCGISMLLFLISVLMLESKHIFSLGITYIATKGITYMIVGLLLYYTVAILESSIFQNIIIITQIISIIFMFSIAGLSIVDYIHCKHGNYGKIRLQLPASLRKFNHSIIENLKSSSAKKYIYLSVIFTAIIISAGEFLCTGQIMIATILYMIKSSGIIDFMSFVELSIYVIAMLIPLIILLILINCGQKLFRLSETVRTHMHIIKLMNAILFIIFAIIMLLSL